MAKNKLREGNGEGSVRYVEKDKSWECIIELSIPNPTGKGNKRIKRRGKTEEEARKRAKQEAKRWIAEFQRNGENSRIDRTKTFGAYMTEYLQKIVKPEVSGSTYKSYVYAMNANFFNKAISNMQLQGLSQIEFEKYFDTLVHEKSQKTAAFPIQLCKRCSTWLFGVKKLLPENYALYAKTRREIKDEYFLAKKKEGENDVKEIFTNEDIVKFYEAYKNNISEYAPAVILILETMIRGQELLALHLDDIDFEKNIIHIRCAVSQRFKNGGDDVSAGLEYYVKVPKNRKERIVPMSPLAREVVEYMIQQTALKCRANPDKLLFPSYHKGGKMRTMDAMEIQFKALCDKIGVDRDVRVRGEVKTNPSKAGMQVKKGLNIHALRHTAITIANTTTHANVINTALMAGHTAIKTENIYTHTTMDALSKVVTPSKMLGLKPERSEMSEEDKELYDMYLKLKEKFAKE